MSNLQRSMLAGGMPPPRGMPPAPQSRRSRPGSFRRRSYSPVSWRKYWDDKERVETGNKENSVFVNHI